MKLTRTITFWKKRILPVAATLASLGIYNSGAATYPATILADHPVAYYRLEDASGSATINDETGNGNTGFVSYITQADGVTVFPQLGVIGIFTNGALFAPTTSFAQGNIAVPVNSQINPTLQDGQTGAPFTAELWAMATSQPNGSTYRVPLDDSSDFSQPAPFNLSAGWNFYQTPGPASTWSVAVRPNPSFIGNTPAAVTIGQWTHLVLTYDGTNATLYVNGASITAFPVPSYFVNNGSSSLLFGYGPPTGQSPFDGEIDEVALYAYALTPNQITNHYAIGTNSITPGLVKPSFSTLPASTNAFAGVPVTFTSQALGTSPLFYQWVRGGVGNIPGATNNNYTFTPSYPADDNATFSVTVTNIAGLTNSPIATLTVLTNLSIDHDAFAIARRAGGYAAFRVVASGAQPITYQWHSISTNLVDTVIPGATADTLWLPNISTNMDQSQYYAHVAGPFGNQDSVPALLSVYPRTNSAPISGYAKVVLGDSPVAYWRLDETNGSTTALDDAGSFDGAYFSIGTDLTYQYPSGIPKEIDTAIHTTNTATMTVPYALELSPVSGPWSVEFWIQATSLDGNNFHTPISSESNPNGGTAVTGWNIYQHVAGVWTWNIFTGGPNGNFNSEFTDNPIVPGKWYHMVLTDDGTNMVWYSNDRIVVATTVAAQSFIPNGVNGDPSLGGGPITLAVRSDGVFGQFDGGIDDVAIYNYVLTPAQIQNHFQNTTHLTITNIGAKTVVTWPAGSLQASTNVVGTYTNVIGATSPFTNSSGTRLFYRVQLQ